MNLKRCNYWKRASKDMGCESEKVDLCTSPSALSPKWVVLGRTVTLFIGIWLFWFPLNNDFLLFQEASPAGFWIFLYSSLTFLPLLLPPTHLTHFKNCSGDLFPNDFTGVWPLLTCYIVFVILSEFGKLFRIKVLSLLYISSEEISEVFAL